MAAELGTAAMGISELWHYLVRSLAGEPGPGPDPDCDALVCEAIG
jgi:hypothetical protein